jgi:hypothetical protein
MVGLPPAKGPVVPAGKRKEEEEGGREEEDALEGGLDGCTAISKVFSSFCSG